MGFKSRKGRLAELKRRHAARAGKGNYAENRVQIAAEIARLEAELGKPE